MKVILFSSDQDYIYSLDFASDAKSCVTVNDLIISPHIENGYGSVQVFDGEELILDINPYSVDNPDAWTLWKHYCDPRTDE
jgi:hypothetical protein